MDEVLAYLANLNVAAAIIACNRQRRGPSMTYRPFQEATVAGPKRDLVGYGRHVPQRALARWSAGRRSASC